MNHQAIILALFVRPLEKRFFKRRTSSQPAAIGNPEEARITESFNLRITERCFLSGITHLSNPWPSGLPPIYRLRCSFTAVRSFYRIDLSYPKEISRLRFCFFSRVREIHRETILPNLHRLLSWLEEGSFTDHCRLSRIKGPPLSDRPGVRVIHGVR